MTYPSRQRSPGKTALKWVAITVGLLFLLGMCGALLSSGATRPAGSTVAPAVTPPPSTAAAPAPSVVAPVGPVTSFTDGGYEVGTDVAAGKYRSDGDTGLCIGQLRSSVDKEFNVVKDKLISGEGRQTVTLKSGQYFETQGCGTWSKAG